MTQPHLPGTNPGAHTASAQSRRSRAGDASECYVEMLHQVCYRAGVAELHKVPTNVKVTRNLGGGRVEGRLLGAGMVDYVGWTMRGPCRPVLVEVKHVGVSAPLASGAPAAWRLPLERVEEHQARMLERLASAGGLALVLVVHGPDAYAVPWHVAVQARGDGRASLGAADLGPWRVDPRVPYLARWV